MSPLRTVHGIFGRLPCRRILLAVALMVGALANAGPAGAADQRQAIILAFGDSLTAGLGLPREAAFPAQLNAWLSAHGIAARVINAGVSGETTAGGLARLDSVLTERPDIVIVELGANDALRGIQPEVTRSNLHAIVTRLKALNAAVLLTGMRAPPNWGDPYQQAFDRIYPELAAAEAVPLYPFFLYGVALQPDLNQPDHLHPNQAGVKVIVDHIGPVVARLFFNHNPPPAQ